MKEMKIRTWSKGLMAVCAALFLIFVTGIAANATAAAGDRVVVDMTPDKCANVRSSADTNSNIVVKAYGGTVFEVVAVTQGTDSRTWYQIRGEVDGATVEGFIRSDLVAVQEQEAETEPVAEEPTETVTEETPAATDTSSSSGVGGFTPMESPTAEPDYLPEGFREVTMRSNDTEVTAWTNDEYVIFYGSSSTGNIGWYIYDVQEGKCIRYSGIFVNGGTLSSDDAAATAAGSNTLVIILTILVIILFVALVIMGVKLLNYTREEGSDDDDEDDEDEEEEEEDDDDEEEVPVRRPRAEGNRVVASQRQPQGQRVVTNAQGQRVVTNAQGQRVVTNAQGQRVVRSAEGASETGEQRRVVVKRTDGEAVQQRSAAQSPQAGNAGQNAARRRQAVRHQDTQSGDGEE